MDELIQFIEISLKLSELADLPLQLSDENVFMLTLPLGSNVSLMCRFGVVKVFAKHNDYKIDYSWVV